MILPRPVSESTYFVYPVLKHSPKPNPNLTLKSEGNDGCTVNSTDAPNPGWKHMWKKKQITTINQIDQLIKCNSLQIKINTFLIFHLKQVFFL